MDPIILVHRRTEHLGRVAGGRGGVIILGAVTFLLTLVPFLRLHLEHTLQHLMLGANRVIYYYPVKPFFKEWETNASMGVSLRDSIEGLTSLILEWRKMELK